MAQRSATSSPAHVHSRPTPVTLAHDTVVFVARSILRIPRGLVWLLRHCYTALTNDKSFFGWIAALACESLKEYLDVVNANSCCVVA